MTLSNPKKIIAMLVSCVLVVMTIPVKLAAYQQDTYQPQQGSDPYSSQPQDTAQAPASAHLTPEQLQDLIAPIALYPDALVAQILAASAYPTQIVEAQRFLQQNPNLKGADLGKAVDGQDWDPSVKALTQFPTVLADMDKNLSWTSELGDANLNQQGDVMDAVQFMRQKAQEAGNLKSTPQQTVTANGSTIIIQPADPDVVYIPNYDPELIYGYPVALWPGFYPWWGVGPYISFGIGFGISPFFGFGWGWHGWGFDWPHRGLLFGGGRYAFHSRTFYDRNAYFHGNYRGYAPYARGDRSARGFAPAARGNVAPANRGNAARSLGAFGSYSRGAETRGYSARGQSSMGARSFGGGGHSAGGGGARGSGARGGGGGRR